MSGSNYCFLTCIQVSQEAWEQPRNTEVQINEEKVGKLPEERIQNNYSKNDQKPWKQNGENARINLKRPIRIKE